MKTPPLFVSSMMPAFIKTLPRLGLCAALLATTLTAHAQEEKKPAAPEGAKTELPAPIMKEVAPGIFEIGKMRLDKKAHSVSFPGKVNMADGMLEYLICTPKGATHESLLVADVQPSDIHFAMLLLGAKGAGLMAPAPGDAPPDQINADYLKRAPKLKGDAVTLSAQWKSKDGKAQTTPLENWLMVSSTKKPPARGPWTYSGSMFYEENFLAQLEGNIASLITNPAALINNPRPGSNDDQIWLVNEKAVPPVDTALEITITLQPADAPAPPK